jgi:hypothetical protein
MAGIEELHFFAALTIPEEPNHRGVTLELEGSDSPVVRRGVSWVEVVNCLYQQATVQPITNDLQSLPTGVTRSRSAGSQTDRGVPVTEGIPDTWVTVVGSSSCFNGAIFRLS